jgi:pyrroloquinoline-quinone synthase
MNLINDKLFCYTVNNYENNEAWNSNDFLKEINNLEYRYHIHHKFDKYIMEGKATKNLIKSWVANRYYYQCIIPKKDAAILSKCDSKELRQKWIKNIHDHDDDGAGNDLWLNLGISLGLSKEEMNDFRHVLPGVKFACDKYLSFVKEVPTELAIASCLTVTFANNIHKERLNNWPKFYDFIDKESYEYFRSRLNIVKTEKDLASQIVLDNFKTKEEQLKVLDVIKMKQDILWSILDSLYIYHFTDIYKVLEKD